MKSASGTLLATQAATACPGSGRMSSDRMLVSSRNINRSEGTRGCPAGREARARSRPGVRSGRGLVRTGCGRGRDASAVSRIWRASASIEWPCRAARIRRRFLRAGERWRMVDPAGHAPEPSPKRLTSGGKPRPNRRPFPAAEEKNGGFSRRYACHCSLASRGVVATPGLIYDCRSRNPVQTHGHLRSNHL